MVKEMDSRFADRMGELGEISSELLNARWTTVVLIAGSAGSHEKARLALLACREVLDRSTDAWFWKPFRESEPTFRVDDAIELHSRLADACARHLIDEGDQLMAMLVQLAVLSGRTPVVPDLLIAAKGASEEASVAVPEYVEPRPVWAKSDQTALTAEGGTDLATLSAILDRVQVNSHNAILGLGEQLAAILEWGSDAERRFGIEQKMVQWLLAGARADGTPWTGLPVGAIAVDAAAELAEYIRGAPQQRHEAILAQVLSVAGVEDEDIDFVTNEVVSSFNRADDLALTDLTPITSALADTTPLGNGSPYKVANRLLWEIAATNVWNTE